MPSLFAARRGPGLDRGRGVFGIVGEFHATHGEDDGEKDEEEGEEAEEGTAAAEEVIRRCCIIALVLLVGFFGVYMFGGGRGLEGSCGRGGGVSVW